jgi:hypothetical protein
MLSRATVVRPLRRQLRHGPTPSTRVFTSTRPSQAPVTLRKATRYTLYLVTSSVVGIAALTGAIFLHDAFTYSERHVDRVPVNPLALHPETGGPRNLPIARVLVGFLINQHNFTLL